MAAEPFPGVLVRHDVRPGDIGRIIALHGELYAEQCGWDWTFEAYAGATFAAWAERFDAARDRIWIVEEDGALVGSIAIISADDDTAQLRWFLLHPSQRGRGLGRSLVGEAVAFAREREYRRVMLWTEASLGAAAHLYRWAGFRLVMSETMHRWGAQVTQEQYELVLS